MLPEVGGVDAEDKGTSMEGVPGRKEIGTYGSISLGKELLSFRRYPIRRIWVIWF